MKKLNYLIPTIELAEFVVENGIATTGGGEDVLFSINPGEAGFGDTTPNDFGTL